MSYMVALSRWKDSKYDFVWLVSQQPVDGYGFPLGTAWFPFTTFLAATLLVKYT